MKKKIAALSIAISFIAGIVIGGKVVESRFYSLTTWVDNIQYNGKDYTITVEDFSGNIWEFYSDGDWELNDICSLLMYNKGTINISDDVVIKATYGGYLD